MSVLSESLAEAAARGVEVTIIVGGNHEPPPLTLRWEYYEKSWCGYGRFRGAGFECLVVDIDGDASEWTLKRHGKLLARGGTYDCSERYHFDACLLEAEAALREEVRKRIALLASDGRKP